MTMTPTRSAYPASVDALMPTARELAEVEGLPSRNRLMTQLRIGAPKARQVRAGLETEGFTETATEPVEPAESAESGIEAVADPDTLSYVETVDTDTTHPGAQETKMVVSQDKPVVDPPEPTTPEPKTATTKTVSKPVTVWPVLLLMLPATVAIWSGWVGLGQLAGFGPIHPLPGIWDAAVIDTSITLPIGMETYSAYALYVWLSGRANAKAIKFARASSFVSLGIGGAGQIAYHLMSAPASGAGPVITAAVACIPVAVLGLGAALAHLVKNTHA